MNSSYPPPKGLAHRRAFMVVLLVITLVIWRENLQLFYLSVYIYLVVQELKDVLRKT
jgi:hypothetical protein